MVDRLINAIEKTVNALKAPHRALPKPPPSPVKRQIFLRRCLIADRKADCTLTRQGSASHGISQIATQHAKYKEESFIPSSRILGSMKVEDLGMIWTL
jgi:hypothetical protein